MSKIQVENVVIKHRDKVVRKNVAPKTDQQPGVLKKSGRPKYPLWGGSM